MECIINGLPVFYEEYGHGKPVLCLHGFPEDHRVMTGCLEPVFQTISDYRRIYLDLPGMGKSKSRDWIKNADVMLDIVKEFVQKVIGDESFLLVGLSYGGYLSFGIAIDSNIKADGIFLICPCTIAERSKRKLPVKGVPFVEKGLENRVESVADFEDFIDMAVVATADTWQRYQNEILPGLKSAETSFIEVYQEHGYNFTFESSLKEIQFDKPVCVLAGKQDNCVGYEDSWELLKHLPRLTFAVLDNAGHNLQIERVELFNLHLRDWLDRVK